MYTYKGISQHGDPRKHYNIDTSLTRAVLLKNSRNKDSITRFDMEHRGALQQVCGHKQGLSLGIVAETFLAVTTPVKHQTRRATLRTTSELPLSHPPTTLFRKHGQDAVFWEIGNQRSLSTLSPVLQMPYCKH